MLASLNILKRSVQRLKRKIAFHTKHYGWKAFESANMRNKLSNMKLKAIKDMNSLISISLRTLAIKLRRTFLR